MRCDCQVSFLCQIFIGLLYIVPILIQCLAFQDWKVIVKTYIQQLLSWTRKKKRKGTCSNLVCSAIYQESGHSSRLPFLTLDDAAHIKKENLNEKVQFQTNLNLGVITHNPHVVWAKITLPTRGLKSVT